MTRKLNRLVHLTLLTSLVLASRLPADAQAKPTPNAPGENEPCSWTPFDIGDLGGGPVNRINFAAAINERGQVVGESTTAANTHHAFLWMDGSMTDLGTLGTSSSSRSSATAINNRGQIAGSSDEDAVLWQDGAPTRLDALPGAILSGALGINDRGQVIGVSVYAADGGNYDSRAWLWEEGSATELPGLPGATRTYAMGINNRGDVVGASGVLEVRFITHAVLWEGGDLIDLGTLPGGDSSRATDINDHGLISGWSNTESGEIHAVLWQDGAIVDLGICDNDPFGGCLIRLNDRGQAVGNSLFPGPTRMEFHGALWDHGVRFDLGAFPVVNGHARTGANDLNNRGEIIGISPGLGSRAIVWSSCHGPHAVH